MVGSHNAPSLIWTGIEYPSFGRNVIKIFGQFVYRIAGNFRMVQNFAFFADRLGATKIRTAKS